MRPPLFVVNKGLAQKRESFFRGCEGQIVHHFVHHFEARKGTPGEVGDSLLESGYGKPRACAGEQAFQFRHFP